MHINPVICQNVRMTNDGENKKCGRYLGFIDEIILSALKANPGKRVGFRCPSCPQISRHSAVCYTDDGKLKFENINEAVKFNAPLVFEVTEISQQVG